jgi:hypothetical protein
MDPAAGAGAFYRCDSSRHWVAAQSQRIFAEHPHQHRLPVSRPTSFDVSTALAASAWPI